MSEMVYRFRGGSRFRGDAAEAAAELERIRAERGALQSEAIVSEATPQEAPLHGYFPWDDATAAHEHRLEIARRLVRAIEVIRDDRPAVSMYVHYTGMDTREGGYEPLTVIVAQPDRYLAALAEARDDLASAQRRVEELLNVARSTGHKRGEVARIMLAVQALQTANEAIHALN